MQRVSTSTSDAVLAVYAAGPVAPRYFSDGTPALADGTIPGAQWFNQVQEELCKAIIHDTAIVSALDVTLDNQLATAIGALKTLRSHATDTGSLTTTHLRALLASTTSRADGAGAACIASTTGRASGALSATVGANNCIASGAQTLVAASLDSDATQTRTAVIASNNSDATTQPHAACIGTSGSLASGATSLVGGAASSTASGQSSAVIGSDTSTASGVESAVVASSGSTSAGEDSAIIGSVASTITAGAIGTAIIASDATSLSAATSKSAAIGCSGSAVEGVGSVLMTSQNARLFSNLSLATGYTAGALGAAGADRDLTMRVNVATGKLYLDDAVIGSPADYAELFENAELGTLPSGALVSGKGKAVRLATKGDRVRGVVSAAPSFVGNTGAMGWRGKWSQDEFGGSVPETHHRVQWPGLTRPSAACRAAEADAETARAAFIAAANAAMCSGPTVDDQHRHCDASNAELSEAWKALQPWKRPRQRVPARVPENEGQWQRYEQAQAACNAADRAMRAEVEARIRDALAALKTAEAEWQLARATAKACSRDIETVRDAFDGMEVDAPRPIPDDAKRYSVEARKLADAFDPSRTYVPRLDRPDEWTVVGLLGQVMTRVDGTVSEGDMVEPSDAPGVGTKAKKDARGRSIECMEVVSPFDAARGFAICLCLIG